MAPSTSPDPHADPSPADSSQPAPTPRERDLGLRLLGESFFLQALDQLSVAALEQPSPLPEWTRKHVALHVIFNGEGFLRLIDWAKTGTENPMYPSREWRDAQIADAAGHMSGRDTIAIAHEVAEEITSELATMSDEQWSAPLVSGRGAAITAADIPWLRAREAWVHSLDLGIGMSALDFPAAVIDRLLEDVEAEWTLRGEPANFAVTLTDRPETGTVVIRTSDSAPEAPVTLTATAAEAFSYLSGRGWPTSTEEPAGLPTPPPWL